MNGHMPPPLSRLALPLPAPLPLPLLPRTAAPSGDKRIASLEAVFDKFGITDGHVLSFHHHYRNGERVIYPVLQIAQTRGIRGLTLAASSLFPCHGDLIPMIEDGTVAHIVTDYMRGPLADAIQAGRLSGTTVLQSHGGRARAITSGTLVVDVAFVAAPLVHADGTATGRGGPLACGPLGYPAVDAAHARVTVVLADVITTEALPHIDIPASRVDAVVPFARPGTPDGIVSGSTKSLDTPQARSIGVLASEIIAAAGLMRSGMSLQSGAGGYSLGAVPIIGRALSASGQRGSFLSGGITGAHASLLSEGVFERIFDVQCFDREAVASSIKNRAHSMMTAEEYASPLYPNAVVDRLDVMLLGAVEVDHSFNINVAVGADGRILGGPGGHPDTAQGAKLAMVTTSLTGGGWAKIVPEVRCVTTEGVDVDVIVTEYGYAVNPARPDLKEALRGLSAPQFTVRDLAKKASEVATQTSPLIADAERQHTRNILIEHRLGHRLDKL